MNLHAHGKCQRFELRIQNCPFVCEESREPSLLAHTIHESTKIARTGIFALAYTAPTTLSVQIYNKFDGS